MTRRLVIDGLFTGGDLLDANAAWPAPDWPGWHDYAAEGHAKRASDRATPLPPALACLLARLAALDLGALLGLCGTAADLSLCGGGLHAMPPGGGLAPHQDADTHPRLGLARAWSACLYVHACWGEEWGGELVLVGSPCVVVAPLPGRLALFEGAVRHRIEPVRCPEGSERRSLALFGYAPLPGDGLRPRAVFERPAAAGG